MLHTPAWVQVAKAPGITIRYLNVLWNQIAFETWESGRSPMFADKTWSLAHVQTGRLFVVDGTLLPEGNYAMIMYPNREGKGMLMEIRKVSVSDYLQIGQLIEAPEGETVYSAAVIWQVEAQTNPRLNITVSAGKDEYAVAVRYGNRSLTKQLKFGSRSGQDRPDRVLEQ